MGVELIIKHQKQIKNNYKSANTRQYDAYSRYYGTQEHRFSHLTPSDPN